MPPNSPAYYGGLMTLGERIEERLRAMKISQSELARRVGVSQPTINQLISGTAQGSKHLHRIAAELGTSPAYLLGESDDLEPIEPRVSSIQALSDELDLSLIPMLDIGYSMGGGTVLTAYRQTGVVPFARTLLRSVMRGTFSDVFVARGEGDSMHPTILDGDLVLIDTSQKDIDKQDRIWAVSYGELGMIKRVRRTPGGSYLLMSDNHTVRDVECFDGEMNVIGRVIWVGRRM